MSGDQRSEVRRQTAEPATAARSVEHSSPGEAASTELARKINRDIILELIRLRQPIARVDLARASGLQNSTVSSIVEQLMSEGWIREGEALKTPRGRRPTQISLNDNLAMLVADIHPERAVLGVVDLNGQLLAQQEIRLTRTVETSVDVLGDALTVLREAHPERTFMGLGVCIPGRVNRETGLLVMAPNLQWKDYNIRAALAERLGMTVELENDANACLLSELWFGHLDGVRNAVLLAISEGVGASLLADSHLISGRMGLAGEFGHICVVPNGPACGCGRSGCWEVVASSNAALGYYRELVPDAPEMDYRELARMAKAGEIPAIAAL
ncbi:MAG: ROK family transcriptional regulator, partial [Janthinobacterium lividum]